jgi:transcriptional regulator with XRE-family HTH domain
MKQATNPFKVGAWRCEGLHPFDAAAERMRIARIAAGLTVDQMATVLCRASRTYLKWEAGDLDIRKIDLFGKVMNLSVEWLLTGNEKELDPRWFSDSKVRILPVTLPWYRKRRTTVTGPDAA